MFAKHLRIVGIIFLYGLLLSACQKKIINISPPPKWIKQKIFQTRSFPAFTHVKVKGNLNVKLHTGYAKPRITLRGNFRDLAYLKTEVQGHCLYIELGKGYPQRCPIVVDIKAQSLNSFSYEGAGWVVGKQIHSRQLALTINNAGSTVLGGHMILSKLTIAGTGTTTISGISSGHLQLAVSGQSRVQLTGITNLTHLNLGGSTFLSMYWIKSNALIIRAQDKSKLQLAGVVGKLDVELCDKARFDGRYLRANRAFIKTHERAVADFSAVRYQHTLASDASDIYFYNLPTMKTDFMAYNGSVLDMRDLELPNLSEYTRYNK